MPDDKGKLSILMIGAHPDDCELKGGGTAIKWIKAGHCVRFVAMTGGDNGHPSMRGAALQQRRREEAREAGKKLGICYSEVLKNHGGELLATLETRREVVRLIREARADIVISHRNTDYHPDHRYTAILVQDSAYMVTVPFYVPSVPALERNPVFLSFEDKFTRPTPFLPQIAVGIDDVFDQKMAGIEAHVSQMFEWTPFMLSRSTGKPQHVPDDPAERRAWLSDIWFPDPPSRAVRSCLEEWYGSSGAAFRHAEAFEICEYGCQIDRMEIKRLFPFLPDLPA
jgi:LmbE family N-acetylglucosaminyl deacetylase